MRSTATQPVVFSFLFSLTTTTAHGGDFNGDGFDDLAVGVPYEDVGLSSLAGGMNIIYGSATGLNARTFSGGAVNAQFWHRTTMRLPEGGVSSSGDYLGSALAEGDFDGDGFDDLAVGIPGAWDAGAHAGLVAIMYGGASGLTNRGNILVRQADASLIPEAEDWFGSTLASGDFNGDGIDDLAIGTPQKVAFGARCGAVSTLLGRAERGFDPAPLFLMIQMFVDHDEPVEDGDRFGDALATGDFDADGFDDLAIGSPGEDGPDGRIDAGLVHIVYGNAAGFEIGGSFHRFTQDDTPGGDPAEPDDHFGSALAAGDFDGNGTDDLAIGADREDLGPLSNSGAIELIGGLEDIGLVIGAEYTGMYAFVTQTTWGVEINEDGDHFGETMITGDLTGDGCDDLIIGNPSESIPGGWMAGQIIIAHGIVGDGPGFGGATTVKWSQDSPGVLESAADLDYFGRALSAGDYDGDGFDDLAAAASGEHVGTTMSGEAAGCVNVLYGSSGGVSATSDQLWHQNSAGVPNAIGPGDSFGGALGYKH